MVKAKFWVEPDPKKAAAILFDHIEGKRADLGI
jgi:hydroxylamine reductase (hybrid-cluster protein)